MVFKCTDGEQRVSRDVLRYLSEFYSNQMNALDRFQNKYVFTCPFSKQCVKVFLDAMHGIRIESLSLITMLELIKFIMHLGKGIQKGYKKCTFS